MKQNLNFAELLTPLLRFMRRFHTLLFFLLVSGGLFAAILTLTSIIQMSSTVASSSSQAISGQFDESTIQLLKRSSVPPAQIGERSNPFVE